MSVPHLCWVAVVASAFSFFLFMDTAKACGSNVAWDGSSRSWQAHACMVGTSTLGILDKINSTNAKLKLGLEAGAARIMRGSTDFLAAVLESTKRALAI